MSSLTSHLIAAVALGQLLFAVALIDPLFIPLILLGPLVSGAVAAARGVSYAWIAMVWVSLGLATLWVGLVFIGDDHMFHLAITGIMPLLAGVGYGVVYLATRSRRGVA